MFQRIEFKAQEPVDEVKRYSTGISSGHFRQNLMKHHPVNAEAFLYWLSIFYRTNKHNFSYVIKKSFFILWRI